MAIIVEFKNIARSHIIQAKQEKQKALEKGLHGNLEDSGSDSVFRKIVNSDMPESELDTERLTKEAQALFGAATVAVARTFDCIAFYTLSDPQIRDRLAAEPKEPMAGYSDKSPAFHELKQLEYLSGVVFESLRLSYGSMHRMPRVFPDVAVQYKQWTIPPDTPVGMSAYFNHADPSIFPEPFRFAPERWVGNIDPRMKKALIPFTRGSRVCLGKNVAVSETFMMTAMLYRPGGPAMELYQTDESDVKSVHDFMIPMPKMDTNGLRVIVQ